MVGRIRYLREKGRENGKIESFCGLTILSLTLYQPPNLSARRLERRLERLTRTFHKAGVSRVILPLDFPHAAHLHGLHPVQPLTFYRAMADLLVLERLRLNGISPERGRVALAGGRLCPELEETARRLCRRVREVRIDVPGEEGETFARLLQREWGLPVMPRTVPADLTLSFGPIGGDLCLWGEDPDLGGMQLWAEGFDLPCDIAPQLMALLWERGSLRREEIRVLNSAEKGALQIAAPPGADSVT